MAKYPIIFAALIFSGCACPPHASITLPPRPALTPVTNEVWQEVGPNAGQVWSDRELALQEYIRRIEARVEIHNGESR